MEGVKNNIAEPHFVVNRDGRESRCVGAFNDAKVITDGESRGKHRPPLCSRFFHPQEAEFAGWKPAKFAGWVGMGCVGGIRGKKNAGRLTTSGDLCPQSKAASVHVGSHQSVYLTRRGNLGTARAARNGQSLPGVCGGGFSAGLGLRGFSDGIPRCAGGAVQRTRDGSEI